MAWPSRDTSCYDDSCTRHVHAPPIFTCHTMDCAGRHIEGYIWGELSCSITLESWAELLAAHSSARGLCAASSSSRGCGSARHGSAPQLVTSHF